MNSEEIIEQRVSNLENAIETATQSVEAAEAVASSSEWIVKSKEKVTKIHPFQIREENGVKYVDCRSAVFYNGSEINFTPVSEFGEDNKLTKFPTSGVIYCWYSFISGEGFLCTEGDIPSDGMIDSCPVMNINGNDVTYYLDSAISATGIDRTYGRIPFQTQKYWIRREDENLPRYRVFIPEYAITYKGRSISGSIKKISGTDHSKKDPNSDWIHLDPLIDGYDWDLIIYGCVDSTLSQGDLIEDVTTEGYNTERSKAILQNTTCRYVAKKVSTQTRDSARGCECRKVSHVNSKYDVFGKPIFESLPYDEECSNRSGGYDLEESSESSEGDDDDDVSGYFYFPVCGVGKDRAVVLVTTVTDELGAIYDDVMQDIYNFKQLAFRNEANVVELVGPAAQASLKAFKEGEKCNNTEIILYCLGQLLDAYTNVCIFYSGHGGTDAVSFPDCEAWVTDFTTSRWCWDFRIAEALSKAQLARKVWLISDSCVSGEMYKNATTFEKKYSSFGEKVIRSVEGGTVNQLLSWGACGKEESAYSDEENGGGLFTNAIVNCFVPGISYSSLWSNMTSIPIRDDQHFTKAVVGEFNEYSDIFL